MFGDRIKFFVMVRYRICTQATQFVEMV